MTQTPTITWRGIRTDQGIYHFAEEAIVYVIFLLWLLWYEDRWINNVNKSILDKWLGSSEPKQCVKWKITADSATNNSPIIDLGKVKVFLRFLFFLLKTSFSVLYRFMGVYIMNIFFGRNSLLVKDFLLSEWIDHFTPMNKIKDQVLCYY